ncbi:hypothetical protein C8R44DRAFT_356147 [Mycena epipterygia]|nr:hypothetical protein C8R44DRAFT_356147 [Mycena epipterygia]
MVMRYLRVQTCLQLLLQTSPAWDGTTTTPDEHVWDAPFNFGLRNVSYLPTARRWEKIPSGSIIPSTSSELVESLSAIDVVDLLLLPILLPLCGSNRLLTGRHSSNLR